jgi:hypothetical protein
MFFHPHSNNSTAGLAMTHALGGKSAVLAEISAVLVEYSASTADFAHPTEGNPDTLHRLTECFLPY